MTDLDGPGRNETLDWWRTAVVYQVYLRSFADASGDGIGDLAGLRDRLPYLAGLGVDALWINPWYVSPQADAGYDVADYRAIDPAYGTLEEAEALIAEAHALGLRVLLDIVPNHTSSEHAWFRAALAGDQRARARYLFRPGKGANGEEPPNNWESTFGGPAWTRTTEPDGKPGEWYLHLFAPEQPDLDWTNEEVHQEFEDVLRFWFDRDADGFRIDVAHGLSKMPGLPDAEEQAGLLASANHPAWDQDPVHEVYRRWRRVADAYDPPRVFVAESWVDSNERLAMYLRPDELHTAFQFDFLRAPFRADLMREVVDDALGAGAAIGAPSTWVLANHDVTRQVTRYARSQPEHRVENVWERSRWDSEEPDLEIGRRRARAALLLVLALPGTTYLYQGEELGLAEVEDIPADRRQDPIFRQTNGGDAGRDGCRVPLPWSGAAPPYGFSPPGADETWLPQPDDWAELTMAAQDPDPGSTLNLYRAALRVRRDALLGGGALRWLESKPEVLAFTRGAVECWVNTGAVDAPLPPGEVLLASGPIDGALPPDTAVWVRP